jgi:hypothetical protein
MHSFDKTHSPRDTLPKPLYIMSGNRQATASQRITRPPFAHLITPSEMVPSPVQEQVLDAALSLATLRPLTTDRSSAWLERCVWDAEVAGSNPVGPTNKPELEKARVFLY